MSGENQDTSVEILTSRYRAKSNQATLNIELALVGQGGTTPGSPGGAGSVGGSPIITEAGSGGGGGGSSSGGCPELGQYVRVRKGKGIDAIQVISLQPGLFLWNPLSREFEEVESCDVIESPLMEVTDGWITAVGSPTHPLIQNVDDIKGLALEKCESGGEALSYTGILKQSSIKLLKHIGDGKVRLIKTKGPGHIYCAGSNPKEMFVFHNAKPRPGEEEF